MAEDKSDQSALEAIADQLYALRPEAFAAARDEAVRKAKTEGRKVLAQELGKLRRPTQSAWLINLLWRDQRNVMEDLFELARGMTQAQAQASGPQLRTLMAQRRQLESALIRQARALAEQAGVKITDATEREAQETLGAALARPEVADEVRSGRLLKPASYAGFGTLPARPAPSTADQAPREPLRLVPRGAAVDDRAAREAQERAQREEEQARERRAAAEQRLAEARAAAESAAGELAEREAAAEAAARHQADLQRQVETVRAQLRGLEAESAAAEEAAHVAARKRTEAEQAHRSTQQNVERAERELGES